MGNIVNYLKQIITSEKGKDVRQSMHDAIKQVYDDAATSGNANMEVTFARGTENTLNDRLTKMDQVAETTTAELATTKSQLSNIHIDVKIPFGTSLTPAKGDGTTDDTLAIQSILDYMYSLGGGTVFITNGTFKTSSAITIPLGVYVKGTNMFTNGRNVFDGNELPSTIYPTSTTEPVFIIEGACGVDGLVFDYKDQVRYLLSETDEFVKYPPTFQLGITGRGVVGAHIRNIYTVGGSIFAQQYDRTRTNSVEKCIFENISGFVTEIFVNIGYATDLNTFNNIHLNLNDLKPGWLDPNYSVVPYQTKIAKEAVFFKMARVDDFIANNCFGYGMKHMLHMYVETHNDDGTNGGATFTASSLDSCYQAFRIERSKLSLGLRVSNAFYTPQVQLEGGVTCLLSIGNGVSHTNVTFTGISVSGGGVAQITGSSAAQYVVSFDEVSPIVMRENVVTISGQLYAYKNSLVNNEARYARNSVFVIGTDYNAKQNNFSPTPFTTNNVGNTPNQYSLLGKIVLNKQHQFSEGKVHLFGGGTTQATNIERGTLYYYIKQQSALGQLPLVKLILSDNSTLKNTDVFAIIETNTPSQTVVGLYIKINNAYDNIFFSPIMEASDKVFNVIPTQWVNLAPLLQNDTYLPTGTKIISILQDGQYGTATINANSVITIVTHAMGYVPNTILCTAKNNLGNIWVSNITDNVFTINCSIAPTANAVVSYHAR